MANAVKLDEKAKAWTTEEIVADPEGWYEATLEQSRRDNPGMTDAQIRQNFEAARAIMGF